MSRTRHPMLGFGVAILLVASGCTTQTTPPPTTTNVPVGTPALGPTVAPPTGTAVTEVAPSGGPTVDPLDAGTPPAPQPDAPSSRDLIAAALAAGQIAWPTSLLDRIWAQWGDPRLPAELAGAGPSQEDDPGVGIDPFLFRSDIPDDVYAKMQPYLVRPTDPSSAFYPVAASVAIAATVPGGHALAVGRPISDAVTALEDCGPTSPWASQNGLHPFKVWAPCTGDYSGDIAAAVSAMNDIWGPETQVMGPPLPDDGTGGDSSIDVYLVDSTAQCVPDRSPCARLPEGAAGAAQAAPAASGSEKPLAASAFLMIPRSLIGDPGQLKFELIHELFHALEYAHNVDGLETETSQYWQIEADAKWAQAWLGSQPAQGIAGVIRPAVYIPYFVNKFQSRDIPLNQPNTEADRAAYRSFIWPFVAQQETGGPQVVGQIWQALEGVDSFSAADDATDRVFSFSNHLADFAFRNLNRELEPNDVVQPRYKALDGTFTDGFGPWGDRHKSQVTVPLSPPGTTNDVADQLAPLTSHYRNVIIDPSVHELVLDFSGLKGGDVKPDAVVEVTGPDGGTSWERRKLSPDVTTWCLDDPGNDIRDFVLILSNASYKDGDAAAGTFSLTGRDACGTVHGNLVWTDHVTQTNGSGTGTGTTTIWLDVLLKEAAPDDYRDDGSSYSVAGSWTHPDIPAESIYTCAEVNMFETIAGAGTFVINGSGGGRLGLVTNYPSAGIAQLIADVSATGHGHAEFVGPADCAHVEGAVGADMPTIVWCKSLAGEVTASGAMSADGRSIDLTCADSRTSDYGTQGAVTVTTVHEVTVTGTLYIEAGGSPTP